MRAERGWGGVRCAFLCLRGVSTAGAPPPPTFPAPAPAPPPATLVCTIFSAAVQPPDRVNLPRYAAVTALSLPVATPTSSALLLASVVAEGRAVSGAFRVVGGVGVGTQLRVTPPPLLPTANGNATPAPWSDPAVGNDSSLLEPLLSLLAPLLASAGLPTAPASLSVTLSGAAHLLLLLSPLSPPSLLSSMRRSTVCSAR